MIGKVIVEGLGLGLLLVLVCAVGTSRGAVTLVHLYNHRAGALRGAGTDHPGEDQAQQHPV